MSSDLWGSLSAATLISSERSVHRCSPIEIRQPVTLTSETLVLFPVVVVLDVTLSWALAPQGFPRSVVLLYAVLLFALAYLLYSLLFLSCFLVLPPGFSVSWLVLASPL